MRTLLKSLSHDVLFWTLLLVLAGFSVMRPAAISGYPALVDWPTIATLTGLLILTKGVELSGFLNRLGSTLMARMRSQRALALSLVAATAALATILTNDVALFVIVPLTLALRSAAAGNGEAPGGLPITRLIIVEALAANAGSALTPIGNPQNLFLWQQSQVSFAAFTLAMLPLALLLLIPLLLLTAAVFSGHGAMAQADAESANTSQPQLQPQPASVRSDHSVQSTHAVDCKLLLTCLLLYPPFLILTDLHHAAEALAVLLLIFLAVRRTVLARIDWGLLLVFILMFIDLRLAGATPPVRSLFAGAGLGNAMHLYLAGIAASQVISNVPATILLVQYSHDWRSLAYGVNVGGAGLAIGSLANIIALRMAGEKRAWLVFHAYSLPFLAVTAALLAAWLAWH